MHNVQISLRAPVKLFRKLFLPLHGRRSFIIVVATRRLHTVYGTLSFTSIFYEERKNPMRLELFLHTRECLLSNVYPIFGF